MGLGLAITARLLAEAPAVVEWHRVRVFPAMAGFLQRVSGTTVGTLGEAGAAVVILGAIMLAACRPRAIVTLVLAAGFVVLTFYLSWGLAYRYPPLSTRLAPPVGGGEASRAVLLDLAERAGTLLALSSEGAISFAGSDAEVLDRTNGALNKGFSRWPASLEAAPVHDIGFGPVKPSRVSAALSRLQVSGYYFPWTGEAQINAQMPRTLWPRVGGHERAHQRGFARENEATLVGLVACLRSGDPTTVYSGALGLFVAVDRELARGEPEIRRQSWAALPKRAIEDLRVEADFWKAREGVVGVVSERVNDTYLKAQGVKSGVGSYGETTRLILQALETESLAPGTWLPRKASASPQ